MSYTSHEHHTPRRWEPRRLAASWPWATVITAARTRLSALAPG